MWVILFVDVDFWNDFEKNALFNQSFCKLFDCILNKLFD